MKSFIDEFLFSDYCGISNFKFPQNETYTKLSEKEDLLYEKLTASLSPEDCKILSELTDIIFAKQEMISELYYKAGFKTGFGIAAEGFNLSDVFNKS